MNYFNFYPGDYLRDTRDLSLAEHGAYVLLMCHYYSTEHALPADYSSLYRIAGAVTEADKAAVKKVCRRFFSGKKREKKSVFRVNKRIEDEIKKAQPRIAASRINGRNSKLSTTQWVPNFNPVGIQQVTHAGAGAGAGADQELRKRENLQDQELCKLTN